MKSDTIINGIKKVWCFLPEICITAALLAVFGDLIYSMIREGVGLLSSVMLVTVAVLLACSIGQFFWKKLVISFIYSILFGFGSIYMTLALISEYREFPAGDPQGIQMLLFGFFLFGGMAFVSFIMPWKYIGSFAPIQNN